MSPEVPGMGNAVTRWIGRTLLLLLGWKIVGQLPNTPKGMIIGVPHTSNWDFFLAMGFMMALGIRFSWLMKKEAFFFPFGGLLRYMNGIPIDRSQKSDVTQQMVDWLGQHDKAWLTIAPEGTRKNVKHFKKGYLRIANAANLNITMAGMHKPSREIRIDNSFKRTGDIDVDNAAVKAYVQENFIGIRSSKT